MRRREQSIGRHPADITRFLPGYTPTSGELGAKTGTSRWRRGAALAATALIAVPGFASLLGNSADPSPKKLPAKPGIEIAVVHSGDQGESLIFEVRSVNLPPEQYKSTEMRILVKDPNSAEWRQEGYRVVDSTRENVEIEVEKAEIPSNSTILVFAQEEYRLKVSGDEGAVRGYRTIEIGPDGEVIYESPLEPRFPQIPPWTEDR